MDKVTHDALSLSSGTLSYLINDTRYAEIDRVQSDFVTFCESREGDFDNWVQAWEAFQAETSRGDRFDGLPIDSELSEIPVGLVHTPDGEQWTFLPDNQQLSLGF